MRGLATGSFAMGHRGIVTAGPYVVDWRPSDLTGLLPVITAAVCEGISTNAHINTPIIHTLTQRGKHANIFHRRLHTAKHILPAYNLYSIHYRQAATYGV